MNAFDAVVPLEGVVERQHNRPAIALFAEALGITDLPATAKPLFPRAKRGPAGRGGEFQRHRGRRSTASASAPGMTPRVAL